MRCTIRRTGGLSWTARAVVAALMVSGSAVATVGIAASSQAQVRPASAGTSATVVKEAARTGFGKILVTINGGMSLYVHPHGGCSASCQSIWPPLLMPTGKKTPKGAPCLAPAKLGNTRQVTYHKQRLYTFTGDTGHSVNGNGMGGFVVAKVTKACT